MGRLSPPPGETIHGICFAVRSATNEQTSESLSCPPYFSCVISSRQSVGLPTIIAVGIVLCDWLIHVKPVGGQTVQVRLAEDSPVLLAVVDQYDEEIPFRLDFVGFECVDPVCGPEIVRIGFHGYFS